MDVLEELEVSVDVLDGVCENVWVEECERYQGQNLNLLKARSVTMTSTRLVKPAEVPSLRRETTGHFHIKAIRL